MSAVPAERVVRPLDLAVAEDRWHVTEIALVLIRIPAAAASEKEVMLYSAPLGLNRVIEEARRFVLRAEARALDVTEETDLVRPTHGLNFLPVVLRGETAFRGGGTVFGCGFVTELLP